MATWQVYPAGCWQLKRGGMMSKTLLTVVGATALACAAEMFAQPQDPGGRRLTGRNSPLQVVEPDAADLSLRMTPVVAAVEKAADSVVSIYIVNQERRGRRGEEETEGQGSGVILDAAGLVITNWHVVATALAGGPAYRVEVRLKDGRSYPSTIMSSSSDADLALLQLQLDGDKVKPVEIGNSHSLMVGETVIAIGNPQGHANTVTTGVLSAVGRSIVVRTPTGVRRYRDLLQTDAAINQGNSGGALLDITGRLIGINNAMAQGSENIGFAIPVDTMREVFENDLLSSENLTSSVWVGTQVQNQGDFVVVTDVDPQSPAGRAGLRVGDHLMRAGQADIHNTLDYTRRLMTARPGETLPLVVQRSGREMTLRLVPESDSGRQLLAANRQIAALAGMRLEEITWEQNEALVREATLAFYEDDPRSRVPPLPVVLRINDVERGGPADDLGLEVGDVILALVSRSRFGGSRALHLDSAMDLASGLEGFRGREAWIWILRDGAVKEGPLPVRG